MRHRRTEWFLGAAIGLAACSGGSTEPHGVRVEATTPTELTGTVASPVTPLPTVRATDQNGNPVPGVLILFTPVDGGTVGNDSTETNAAGLATPGAWTLSGAVGAQRLTAASGGQVIALFTALATAGPVAGLAQTGGIAQVAAIGETLLEPLQVRVADGFDNPVPNATVTFMVSSGGGSIEGSTAVTDAAGLASSGTWTLGAAAGVQEVTARSGSASVVFSAFACDTCPTLLMVRNGSIYRTIGHGGQDVPVTVGFAPAWSPDGERVAFVRNEANRNDIYLMNADGSNIVRRTMTGGNGLSPAGFHSPSWSPDGLKLAIATGGHYEGYVYVLSADDDGQEPVAIQAAAAQPTWSPDGSQIAFVGLSGDDGYHELLVMSADGTDVRIVTPRDPGTLDHPAWSPDGSRIAFTKCLDGSCDVYIVKPDGSGLTKLTFGRVTGGPTWSPDGGLVAFTLFGEPSGGQRSASIAFVPAAGGEIFTIVASGGSPAWRP